MRSTPLSFCINYFLSIHDSPIGDFLSTQYRFHIIKVIIYDAYSSAYIFKRLVSSSTSNLNFQ